MEPAQESSKSPKRAVSELEESLWEPLGLSWGLPGGSWCAPGVAWALSGLFWAPRVPKTARREPDITQDIGYRKTLKNQWFLWLLGLTAAARQRKRATRDIQRGPREPGTALKSFRQSQEVCGEFSWGSWGSFGFSWALLGLSLGFSWGLPGSLWGLLRSFGIVLGFHWGSLGVLLGFSWALLGISYRGSTNNSSNSSSSSESISGRFGPSLPMGNIYGYGMGRYI